MQVQKERFQSGKSGKAAEQVVRGSLRTKVVGWLVATGAVALAIAGTTWALSSMDAGDSGSANVSARSSRVNVTAASIGNLDVLAQGPLVSPAVRNEDLSVLAEGPVISSAMP